MTDLCGSFEKVRRNFFGSTFLMSMGFYNVCDVADDLNDGKFNLCVFVSQKKFF